MNGLALCAGIGGIELGLSLVVPRYRTICHVEGEAYAAATLARRMDDGCIEPAPIHGDLRSFDARPLAGLVDLISGGYPCQPFSISGTQRGTEDPRHLWPHFARIMDECEPSLALFENVRGHLAIGFTDVLADLAALGFDAEWDVFSAAGSGGIHYRRRLFVLAAHPDRAGRTQQRRAGANGQEDHPIECVGQAASLEPLPLLRESLVQRAPDARLRVLLPGYRGMATQPVCVTAGGSIPGVGRVADDVSSRVGQLRALGNAVVPAVAARAFTTLAARMNLKF